MEGQVYKLSDWRKQWNERYFELVRPQCEGGTYVLRYRHQKDGKLMPSSIVMDAEAVRISDVNQEPEVLSEGLKIYRWSVVSVKLSGLRFDLASPSLKMSKLWVRKLRNCMRVVGMEDDGEGDEEEVKEEEIKHQDNDVEEVKLTRNEAKDENHRKDVRKRAKSDTIVLKAKHWRVEADTKVAASSMYKKRSTSSTVRNKRIPPTIQEDEPVFLDHNHPAKPRLGEGERKRKRRERTESWGAGTKAALKFGPSFILLHTSQSNL